METKHDYNNLLTIKPSSFGEMAEWHNPTIAAIREAFLEFRVTFMMDEDDNKNEIENSWLRQTFSAIMRDAREAVIAGRLFDMGHLPNAVISSESTRSAKLYTLDHINHPFRDPYVLYHTWEGGGCAYVVKPYRQGSGPKTTFRAAEFQCMTIGNRKMLFLSDNVEVQPIFDEQAQIFTFNAVFTPCPSHALMQEAGGKTLTPNQMVSQIADPVMACMLLLSTEGVPYERIEPSSKLNKARLKNHKPLIPSYWKVHTDNYVTALKNKGKPRIKNESQGGTHASPVPHLRRGHPRNLASGKSVWVRDCLVNLKDPNSPLQRSFYQHVNEQTK